MRTRQRVSNPGHSTIMPLRFETPDGRSALLTAPHLAHPDGQSPVGR